MSIRSCVLYLQAKDLERATIMLGKSDSPTALMQVVEVEEQSDQV